jgi:tetratricopeptide (TPR) repeat protein
MSVSELDEIVSILKLETKCRSSIGIQHLVQQFCRSEPVPTFVIVPSLESLNNTDNVPNKEQYVSINTIKHSCLPTALLELNDDNEISLQAQFDIVSDDDVSICYVIDDIVESRDKMLQCRIGQSCFCVRCQYELASDQSDFDFKSMLTNQVWYNDLIRIGHFFMLRGEFKQAKAAYGKVLKNVMSVSSTDVVIAEIYHALGAVELSMGNFLQAQKIWKNVYHEFPELCRSHDGIALQVEKMKSYEYFEDERHNDIIDISFRWDSPAPNCYMASVLDSETCQRVINWAETLGKWTTKRHYAVPTFDVPIHTVPPLLEWFQNCFMNPIMQPLLAKQFQCTNTAGRFYVHDAFCVRYESNAVANHLPIHVDESSHSLVVALNDGFEGGGTYFPDYDIVLCPPKGTVISFRGDTLLHGGQAVTRGVRYILAVFLYYDASGATPNDNVRIATKRDQSELNRQIMKSKQQKIEFSFNFQC